MRSTLTRTIWLMLCIFASARSLSALAVSITDIHFSELNQRNGLSELTIMDIAEDQDGYIWIATVNGLNRYSGYDTKQYHPSEIDKHSLPSGFIRTLLVDSKGTLWVGTFEGLARYNPKFDNFDVFDKDNSSLRSSDIWELSEDRDGNILVADKNSVYVFDTTKSEIAPLNTNVNFPTDIKVILDDANRIWLGTYQHGAFIYDKSEKTLSPLDEVNKWGIHVSATMVFDIKIIDGQYWVATDQGVIKIKASGEQAGTINQESSPSLLSSRIHSILEQGDTVWLGTPSGLSGFDKKTGKITTVGADSSDLTGLTNKFILSLKLDSTGGLWVGTLEGLFRYHPNLNAVRLFNNQREFQRREDGNSVWGLAEDKQGNIWFATQHEGLGRFDSESGSIEYYLTNSDASFWFLAIDKYDHYWLATSEGLKIYAFEDNQFIQLGTLFKGSFIDNMYFDGIQLWIWLTEKGLVSVRTNLLTQYIEDKDSSQFIQQHDVGDVRQGKVPVYKDEKDRLWLTSDEGISLYDDQKNEIVKKITDKDGLKSRAIGVYDWRNFYWITTHSDGVVKIDKRTLNMVDKQDSDSKGGLVFSTVGIGSSIWYADNFGLHRVELSDLKLKETITPEQLQYNSLNESAVLKTSNDDLIFAGNEGFNRISLDLIPEDEKSYVQTREPQLFDFEIFGETAVDGTDSEEVTATDTPVDASYGTPVTYKQKVDINYDESRLSITFGLINPLIPEAVKYRYRLDSYDKTWIYSGNNRVAQYNNVPFGNYTFEVQAKENNRTWSDSRTLAIEIGRPPWLATVALAFYAFLLTVFMIYVIRQYQMRKANQQAIQESEERLKLTLWSSGDELWDWDVYRGQVFRSNTWGSLDFPQDNIRTHSAYDANIHSNDLPRVQEALKAHLEGKTEYYELAYRAKTFKNKWIWILDRGKVVQRDHNQQPMRMTGTLKNIHHLKEAEEQLNLFKRSIENISEGVFITNTQFKFISVNNAYCKYTGETREQALATYMYFHQYPEAFTEEIKKTLRSKGNWFGEVESVRVNGDRYEMELNIDAVHDEDGKISHFVGVFSDITSRKSTEKELLKLANTDPLTELPNRSFYQASHQNLVRKSVPHALLCLDMDNFKKINDSLGHQTGDILIKQIAKRVQRITGTNATCYRLGGDEFSVLMEEHSDIHTITHYAQNLLDTLSRPFIINKQEFVLGASIGIAFYPDDGNTPQEMLKNADTAMYFAKNNGGNSYQFFSGEMNQNAVRQLQIENLIRQGIKDDLFTVYYQPKVDIASGKLVSMEALVRFEHPHKGVVSPGQFIPLAEQTGQIIEIGEQVLRKACADTKRWVNMGIFSGRVAVNISAKQFELPNLDDRIDKILQDVGLSPLHLECEITEGTLMENPDQGLQMMERLRERGIHLALDDFGTGYSSLAYLKKFPLNTLKIDKAFIDDIAESSVDRHMAAAIINIAHNLGLKVVAEGVEYENQLTILRRYDCEMLQGFLYSKPLSADRFEKLLQENQKLHHLIGQPSV